MSPVGAELCARMDNIPREGAEPREVGPALPWSCVSGRVVFAGGVEKPGSGMCLSLRHCLSVCLGVAGCGNGSVWFEFKPGELWQAGWGMLSGVQVLTSPSFPLLAGAWRALSQVGKAVRGCHTPGDSPVPAWAGCPHLL